MQTHDMVIYVYQQHLKENLETPFLSRPINVIQVRVKSK